MPDISKIEVNGVEYDIKDPVARANKELIPDHVHSWEELEDKPFEEIVTYEEVMPEQEITGEDWDGQYGCYVQDITVFTPDIHEYVVTFDGTEYRCKAVIADKDISIGNTALTSGGLDTGEPFGISILASMGMGAILLKDKNSHSVRVVGIKPNIKKLDEKFIPTEWFAQKTKKLEELLTQNNLSLEADKANSDGYWVYGDTETGTLGYAFDSGLYSSFEVEINGVNYGEFSMYIMQLSAETQYLGNGAIFIKGYPDNGIPFFIYSEAGSGIAVIFYASPIETITVRGAKMVPEKLPEEYLPESVSGVIIRSSTSGSTKKFKLTVDDTGAIKATEV